MIYYKTVKQKFSFLYKTLGIWQKKEVKLLIKILHMLFFDNLHEDYVYKKKTYFSPSYRNINILYSNLYF